MKILAVPVFLTIDKLPFTRAIRYNMGTKSKDGKDDIAMKNELTYHTCGDYLIPDIKFSCDTHVTLGKYGHLRRQFLQQNAPILYNDLILTERLFPHLQEIDETAHQRLELIQRELLQNDPAPDKATDQMAWVQHMNTIKAQAEEIIFAELIYA